VLGGLAAQFERCDVIDEAIMGEPLQALYAELYRDDWIAGWAAMQAEDALPPRVEALIEAATRDSLTMLFEAPPVLIAALDRLGRPWIDVRVDPRRFLADLLLSFRASDPGIGARLAEAALDADFLAAEIAYVRARHFHLPASLPPDALVVLAQVTSDASLIHGGAIARPADFAGEIAATCRGRNVVLKPHPYDDGSALAAWQALLPGAAVIDTNFYALIAVEPPADMLTLSSGSAVEAALFGHRVRRLLPAPAGQRAALLHGYWYPGFWEWCLGRSGLRPAEPPFVPDRLRRTLNLDWSKRF
jgi:hypothetical protein